MSLLLFNRAFYPNLVRAVLAGNGVTMVGAFLTRFWQKAWLFLPFGDHGVGPLGDIAFNSSSIFAVVWANNTVAIRPSKRALTGWSVTAWLTTHIREAV